MCRCIKERLSKVFTEVKRHWLTAIANLAVWVGAGVFSYIIWIFGGGRVTFGPLSSYFFICLSIVIAITAALNSGIASILASKSLALTRATTRPFLTLEKAEYDPHMPEIILYICNTGALPGDRVSAEIFFMRLIDDRQLITGSISYPLPSIFPKEEKILAAVINNDTVQYINSGEEARILVSIKYQSVEKECNTRRMLRWPTGKEARQHPLRLEVLEEGNYWD